MKKQVIGWREWVSLPDFLVAAIKVKVDTGAATSSLHAEKMKLYAKNGKTFVKFEIYPEQNSSKNKRSVKAEVKEMRKIRSSNGQEEVRPVIEMQIQINGEVFPILITLTNRELMGFRMLLGRQALKGRYLVHPNRSYLSMLGIEMKNRGNE